MSIRYRERIRDLETEYERLYDEIESRHGGVDYQGRLAALRKEIEALRKKAAKFDAVRKAVESQDEEVGSAIVEVLINHDETETIPEIAADFVENELGRFDWMNNWRVIKQKGEAVTRIQNYLNYVGVQTDPMKIVDEIERMARNNPGRWK